MVVETNKTHIKSNSHKKTKSTKHKKVSVSHNVLWVPDNGNDCRCAAVLYLLTKHQQSHMLVLLPDADCVSTLSSVLGWAKISCSSATKDPAVIQQFKNGDVQVLLAMDNLTMQNGALGPLRMVVIFRARGELYQRRLSTLRRYVNSSEHELMCVTIADKGELQHLRQMIKAQPTDTHFTQRTVEDDVLSVVKQHIIESGVMDETSEEVDVAASAVVAAATVTTANKKHQQQHNDDFFSDIGNNFPDISKASVKTKRKREKFRIKKQDERRAQKLSDIESADDDDSDEDTRRPPSSKKKTSYTDALTNVTSKGVNRQKHALSYEERKAYKERTQTKK